MKILNKNSDQIADEDDHLYDCNTIISEEDVSSYTSKEHSIVYRRNNSSSHLQTTPIEINQNPIHSFTASKTLNKRFTKKTQRKKLKIGGLFDPGLKSPAQSILTTSESTKNSDTTK